MRARPSMRVPMATFAGSGAVGGLIGGLVMAVWVLLDALFAGVRPWSPFVLEAASLPGVDVTAHGRTGAIVLGLGVHFGALALFGACFGSLAAVYLRGEPATRYAAWGFVFGAVVWLLAEAAEIPAPHPGLAARMAPWAFAVGLVLYGSVAGSYVGGTAGQLQPSRR